jgi:hypothetical protein
VVLAVRCSPCTPSGTRSCTSAGAQLWVERYNGPGNFGEAYSVAVSPSGGTVYVTGYSYGCVCGGLDYGPPDGSR